MRRFFKEYFSFSASEMRLITILAVLVLLLISGRILIGFVNPEPEEIPEEMKKEVADFISSFENSAKNEESNDIQPATKTFYRVSNFDPNTVTEKELLEMGFSPRVSSNIIKFRRAGGNFREAADMKKIYGMSVEEYNRIYAFIVIPADTSAYIKYENYELDIKDEYFIDEEIETFTIEVNSAREDEIMKIRGIGEVLSARIVKYREVLGGYSRIDQLAEVYGINDSLLRYIENYIVVDTGLIRKLSINNSDYGQLLRHPYIDKTTVDGIMELRLFLEEQIILPDLKRYGIMHDSIYEKVKNYLVP
jgi:DNA uptake protein ComE-like DNA-binding protein